MEVIKSFFFNSTIVNIKERKILFEQIISYLKETDKNGKL